MVIGVGERTGIQVIARASAILRALEGETAGLSLGDLAKRVELPRSTVQRIVGALVDEQMLIPATRKARVKLGPAIVRLAERASGDIGPVVRPVMEELSRHLGETVDLSALKENVAVFIDQVLSRHRLTVVSGIGVSFPLHSTANGKALLACLPLERRKALLGGRLQRDTPCTITDGKILERDIERYFNDQIAYDREEHTVGICAIGTAFVDAFGREFALSIPVPTARFKNDGKSLKRPLLAARDEVVRRLGGTTPQSA